MDDIPGHGEENQTPVSHHPATGCTRTPEKRVPIFSLTVATIIAATALIVLAIYPPINHDSTSESEDIKIQIFDDNESLSHGQHTYLKYCAPCHRIDGHGRVGVNLTDSQWIHGGDIASIYQVLSTGVFYKGMPDFHSQLTPRERMEVGSYVLLRLPFVKSQPTSP